MNEAYKVLLWLVTTLSLRHTHFPSLLIFYSLSYFYPSLLVSFFPRFCYLNRLLSLLLSPPYLSFLSRFSSLSLALVCSPKMTASFPFCLCFNFLWPSPIPTLSPPLLLADNLLHLVLSSLPVQPLQNKVHGCVMLFVCCG